MLRDVRFRQIPDNTHGETVCLIVVVPVYIGIVVVQVAVPCVCCVKLTGTPPDTVDSNIVECSIIVTVAPGKAGKKVTAVVFTAYNPVDSISVGSFTYTVGYRI